MQETFREGSLDLVGALGQLHRVRHAEIGTRMVVDRNRCDVVDLGRSEERDHVDMAGHLCSVLELRWGEHSYNFRANAMEDGMWVCERCGEEWEMLHIRLYKKHISWCTGLSTEVRRISLLNGLVLKFKSTVILITP
jgi:hypothetical protein